LGRGEHKTTLRVRDDAAGARLQDFLAGALPGAERADLRWLVEAGGVTVNGLPAAPKARVWPGDVVAVEAAPDQLRWREQTPAPALAILAESARAVVVDKPAGLPTVPDRLGRGASVHGALAALRPAADLRIVHRLDKDTSGCLALAKGLEAARAFDLAFRERRVRKGYTALVEGRIARAELTIRHALGPDPRRPGLVTAVADDSKGARAAVTRVVVLEHFHGHTLVRLEPETGRAHQLRAHLRSVGHPIAGDVAYGASGPLYLSSFKRGYKLPPGVAEAPLVARTFLHASDLELPADLAEGFGRVESPLPRELSKALDKLRRFAGGRGGEACG
jgi:RluA family pseudouridine synthase